MIAARQGEPGHFTIERSTNLIHWETLTRHVSLEGRFEWSDDCTGAPQRFYQVRWSP